jgi:IS30 family transposase
MTPWQKVHKKFGMSSAALAKLLGRHRSKISRALKDDKGLISGRDQELIIEAARQTGASVEPHDMLPGA